MADRKDVRLTARLDWPAKTHVLTLAVSASLGDVRSQIAKVFEISDLRGYNLTAASFGVDVVELRDKTDKEPISSCGLVNGAFVLVTAPVDQKPPRARRNAKGKDEKEDKEQDRDIYKGWTAANALGKLAEARAPKTKKLALEYVDMYTADIVKTAAWARLSRDSLLEIIKRDWLSIEEGPLLEACVTWARAEIKRKSGKEEKDEIKKTLAPVLPFIRFPCMDVTTVATKVNPSGLLESQQILDLFTFLGLKNSGAKQKLPDSLAKFNSKPREPRKRFAEFKWSETLKWGAVQITDGGLGATANGSSNQTVAADVVFEKGVHEWEIEIKGDASAYSMIGLVPATFNSWGSGSHIGDTTLNGWGLFLYNPWQSYRANSSTPLGSGATGTGPVVVGLRLDCEKGTLEAFRGGLKGSSVGMVFSNVVAPVRPAVTIYQGTVHLKR